jgi:20S proteasome alpha/beta subunit
MECSFALTGKGYVLIAADQTAARSIVKMKHDEDKVKPLGPHLLMTYSGEPGKPMNWLRDQFNNMTDLRVCNSQVTLYNSLNT